MMRFVAVIAVMILLAVPVRASWEDFSGVTQWQVDMTEEGCGTDKTETELMVIQHNGPRVEIADPVHGRTVGTFEGDVLRIKSRIIPDGVGSSRLSDADVFFTCTGMSTKYRWDYKDQNVQCSGSTTWKGKRLGSTECPRPSTPQQKGVSQELEEWRAQEKRLKEKLAKDPKDFWANYDMADLKKKQGNYKDYFISLNQALAHEKMFPETRQKLKEHARKELGLSEYPSSDTVPILRNAQEELKKGGVVHKVKFPVPGEAFQQRWQTILWNTYIPNSNKLLKELTGVKGDEQ